MIASGAGHLHGLNTFVMFDEYTNVRVKLPRVTKVTVESKSSKVRSKYAALKIHNKLIIIDRKFY